MKPALPNNEPTIADELIYLLTTHMSELTEVQMSILSGAINAERFYRDSQRARNAQGGEE